MKNKISISLIVFSLIIALSGTIAIAEEQKAEQAQPEDNKILFLCYWELNENMESMERIKVAKFLKDAGMFPPPGVEIIRFDKTPDNWGVTVFKADSAVAANNLISMWRVASPGIFKKVKMSPALTVPESVAQGAKLYKAIKEAEAKMAEQKKMKGDN